MTLYYTLVFAILVTEMATFLLLVAPLPEKIRRQFFLSLSKLEVLDKLRLGLKFTFVFILILFVDSVNRVYRVSVDRSTGEYKGNLVATERSELQARKFYSQRNMYLCGFTLFLSLILNRTYSLVIELINARDLINELKGKSNSKVKAELSASDDANKEITLLKAELQQKDKDIAALKTQSANLSTEYNRISDELNASSGNVRLDKKTA
ncbi:Endoplasmic reticulum transmembrane protein 3 [Yarrowia sp. C11]|nr:Endoplasmic reticulum transmembrane protein 3 [Yarrowia sp. C11]KAG5370661.1 Endoplasmic reticulum transmembrane protein 3 [Yarrowia sp. E02]